MKQCNIYSSMSYTKPLFASYIKFFPVSKHNLFRFKITTKHTTKINRNKSLPREEQKKTLRVQKKSQGKHIRKQLYFLFSFEISEQTR